MVKSILGAVHKRCVRVGDWGHDHADIHNAAKDLSFLRASMDGPLMLFSHVTRFNKTVILTARWSDALPGNFLPLVVGPVAPTIVGISL